MNDNRRYWLWFIMALHPGNERIWQMVSYFKDVRKAYKALCDGEHPSLSDSERKAFKATHIEQCDSIIEYCENNGHYIMTIEDENYPELLRNIYNPPVVLFCMGDITIFDHYPAVTCVGTRYPSKYSLDITKRICAGLVNRDFIIVSGFALGVDSFAHSAALEAGGRTAAVLACGLDGDYPRENAVYKSLIAKNGLIITEYLPGTHPTRECFHLRNRIMSGLTFGTVVFEADENSGSLITARHAAEQGRTVFCVPPADIFDKRYAGVIKYLRDGAIPVFSHLDIIYDYFTSSYFRMVKSEFKFPEMNIEDNDIPKRDSRTVKKKKGKAEKSTAAVSKQARTDDNAGKREEMLKAMSEEHLAIIKCLDGTELLTDEITEQSGVDPLNILAYLTELEMSGAVELTDGRKYRLTEMMQEKYCYTN